MISETKTVERKAEDKVDETTRVFGAREEKEKERKRGKRRSLPPI